MYGFEVGVSRRNLRLEVWERREAVEEEGLAGREVESGEHERKVGTWAEHRKRRKGHRRTHQLGGERRLLGRKRRQPCLWKAGGEWDIGAQGLKICLFWCVLCYT